MKTVRQVLLCRTANERKIGTYNEKIILKNTSSDICTEGVLFFRIENKPTNQELFSSKFLVFLKLKVKLRLILQ